jgi:Domain of unknown function (DUF4259)
MNTWGTGSFENDAANAFVAEVVQDGAVALDEAFEVVMDPDTDFVASEEGARAVAAAEVLSAHLTGETGAVTDAGLRAWLNELAPDELEPLRALALEALERLIGPESDLPDAWDEADDAQAWLGNVQRLQDALSGGGER